MKKIILAGATGKLGAHLLCELKQQGYYVRVLARSERKARALSPAPDEVIVADATEPQTLRGCCEDTDVVISALGKSISLQDQSKGSFHDIDYMANYNLLQEARAANVRQFIYVSAFTAELHPELAYFKAHADFSEALKRSKLPCTILQPTALFSAFDEVVAMARKGRIGSLGKGYQLTNPIYEGDVAKVAVAAIGRPSRIIPLGGKHVYSRLQLIKIACRAAGYEGSIPKVPPSLVETLLPLVKLFNRNLHDKLAFMVAVSKQDCIAPKVGDMSLEEYFKLHPRKAA